MKKQKGMSKFSWKVLILSMISLVLIVSPGVAAEDPAKFPSKPISMIIQFGVGGSTDLVGRALSTLASKILGQPIVVENKPGGAGVIAATYLKNATPDGYTVGTAAWSAFVYAPHLRSVPYNVKQDFTWIMQYAEAPQLFGVRPDSRWKTFKEFIEDARKTPAKLTYATSGAKSGQNILIEQVGAVEKVKITHMPANGGPEVVAALMGGHVDAGMCGDFCAHAKTGRVRGLAVMSEKRLNMFPDVPTFYELYKLETPVWFGFAAPGGLNPHILKKLQDAFKKASDDPSFKQLLSTFDMVPYFRDSESFTAKVHKDFEAQGKIIKELF